MAAMKIYLVEDSPVVQERLIAMLDDIEHVEVLGVADNAADATAAILRLQPDAVVLDIKLRIGSGISVLREIRRQGALIATIMLTNNACQEIRNQCLALGADHFFDKTGEFEKIREVLEQLGEPDLAY